MTRAYTVTVAGRAPVTTTSFREVFDLTQQAVDAGRSYRVEASVAKDAAPMTRDEQLKALRWHSTVAGLAKGAMVEIAHVINAGHTPAPDGKGWTTMQLPAGTVGSVVHVDEDGMKVRIATAHGTETVWVWPADWSAVVPQ